MVEWHVLASLFYFHAYMYSLVVTVEGILTISGPTISLSPLQFTDRTVTLYVRPYCKWVMVRLQVVVMQVSWLTEHVPPLQAPPTGSGVTVTE